jgi:prolipoprotein diacylglyceryltransferase
VSLFYRQRQLFIIITTQKTNNISLSDVLLSLFLLAVALPGRLKNFFHVQRQGKDIGLTKKMKKIDQLFEKRSNLEEENSRVKRENSPF